MYIILPLLIACTNLPNKEHHIHVFNLCLIYVQNLLISVYTQWRSQVIGIGRAPAVR